MKKHIDWGRVGWGIFFTLTFIGGIIVTIFTFHDPIGMMSWSVARDWLDNDKIFMAGLFSGLLTGISFTACLVIFTTWRKK